MNDSQLPTVGVVIRRMRAHVDRDLLISGEGHAREVIALHMDVAVERRIRVAIGAATDAELRDARHGLFPVPLDMAHCADLRRADAHADERPQRVDGEPYRVDHRHAHAGPTAPIRVASAGMRTRPVHFMTWYAFSGSR